MLSKSKRWRLKKGAHMSKADMRWVISRIKGYTWKNVPKDKEHLFDVADKE